MNEQDKPQGYEEGVSFSEFHRKNEHALEKNKKEGKTIDSGYRCQLDEKDVFKLAVAQQAPGKASEKMGQNVFHRNPDKRSEKERQFWIRPIQLREEERKESPEKCQVKHEYNIDNEAQFKGKISIMNGHRRNPVDK